MNNRMEFRELGLILLFLAGVSSDTRCSFPTAWHGSYFHLGYSSSLLVSNQSITEKGECIWNSGSQYVLQGMDGGEKCWRCLSIYRKHQNVLQYKESDCEYKSQFVYPEELCMRIPGDGSMFSMFRKDAAATQCPLKGPFMFSYAKGGTGRPCSYPKSYMDTCKDHNRLQLHYQACTDVQGSESTSEQLKCIANWNEGSKSYFVGELEHEHRRNEERRYRCFVYEQHGKAGNRTVRMAQSSSATCEGLWSPAEGYRVFDMERVGGSGERCLFPSWFSRHHSWSALDGTLNLHVNSGEKSFKLQTFQNYLEPGESQFTCQDIIKQDRDTVKVVHYVKSDCDSGYVCAIITKIADNVISVQFGEKSRNPSEACTDLYFFNPRSKLLVSRTHSAGVCPLNGRYSLESLEGADTPHLLTRCSSPGTSVITAGCGSPFLRVETKCSKSNLSNVEYRCHAHWTEPGLTRLILSDTNTERMLCLSYTERQGRVSISSCSLEPAQMVLQETGPCLQALSSVSSSNLVNPNLTLAFFLYVSSFICFKCMVF